jgi:hypothetical protein
VSPPDARVVEVRPRADGGGPGRGDGTPAAGAGGALPFVVLVVAVMGAGAVGVLPRWPGLLHLVALPPLDLAADLRWLLARATGWPTFLAGVLAMLAVRTTVWALVLARDGRPQWRLAASVQSVALLPLLAAAQFDFVAHAALYSRLFGVAVGMVLVVWVLLAGTLASGAGRLGVGVRANARVGFRAVELAGYLAVLVVLGAIADAIGPWASVALVPVSGALTWATVQRLRGPAPSWSWWGSAAVAAGVLAVWAVVVVTRGTVPFDVSDPSRDGSALLMSGINSASGEGAIFELEPERIGFTCDEFHYFSYAGAGDGQPQGSAACPKEQGAPYEPEDTQRPFAEQVALLEEQVAPLERPVVVLAHSQAAWVAWQAAAEGRLDGVTHLVLIGPFPSSPLGFPPPGAPGAGRVGGELFRLLEPVPQLVDFDFVVDAPLTRELLATPDAAAGVFRPSLPSGMTALALTATSDLALMPDGWRLDGAVDACPIREAHPYLPITPALHAVVDRFLDGDPGDDRCPRWPEWYRHASQAFGAPPHDR